MNKRRRLTGVVKSNKMTKTVIVEVSRTYQHPLYHKVVRSTKAYKAHDELGCNVGDEVVIVESAPISATVSWNVEKVIKVEVRQEGIESTSEAIEEVEELIEAETVAEKVEELAETEETAEKVEESTETEEVAEEVEVELEEEEAA
jgi:small subunit ribosomal protein S17